MIDFLASEVMRAALLPALTIAVAAGTVSVMVVAHRLAFLCVGVSHASLAGLGLAVFIGAPLLPMALLTALGVAVLLNLMPKRAGIGTDTGTGILFAAAMALGVILISHADSGGVDLLSLLFGNILTVPSHERIWLLATFVLTLTAFTVAARPWWSLAMDPVCAEAEGVPAAPYQLALYILVAITVIMGVKLSGIVLASGLMVLPASIAWFWGRGLMQLWIASVLFAIVGTWAGMWASYAWDWPTGATVVLALSTLFFLSWGISWIVRRGPKPNL